MSKKAPLITDQIAAIEAENIKLKSLFKLFDSALKTEFGMDSKHLHKCLENSMNSGIKNPKYNNNGSPQISDFETKICDYYGLFYDSDKDDFLRIMLTKNSLKYYKKMLIENGLSEDNHDLTDDRNDEFSGMNESEYSVDDSDYSYSEND